MSKPLFPFSLDDARTAQLVFSDNDYQRVAEKEHRFVYVERIETHSEVTADKKLKLWAWAATTAGGCHMAGKFWEKTVELNDEAFYRYVDLEIEQRAIQEIAEEERMKLRIRIAARAKLLRSNLMPEGQVAPA